MSAYQVFLQYFGWPDGAVWSNLIASVICVGTAYFRLKAHQLKLHQQTRKHITEATAPVPTDPDALPPMDDAEIERRIRTWARRDPRSFAAAVARINRRNGVIRS